MPPPLWEIKGFSLHICALSLHCHCRNRLLVAERKAFQKKKKKNSWKIADDYQFNVLQAFYCGDRKYEVCFKNWYNPVEIEGQTFCLTMGWRYLKIQHRSSAWVSCRYILLNTCLICGHVAMLFECAKHHVMLWHQLRLRAITMCRQQW